MKTGIVVALFGLTLQPAIVSAQTAVSPSATDQRRHEGMSILEGSLGMLPRRFLVEEDRAGQARRILSDAGLADELRPE